MRQQLVDEVSSVEAEDKGRGYEIAKGQYLQVEDEVEAIQVESTHTIECVEANLIVGNEVIPTVSSSPARRH